jgi:hypothetical protein
MITVGIDPGAKGAIVALDDNKNVLGKHIMPINKDGTINGKGLFDIITSYTAIDTNVRFALEKVHAIFGMSAKSCFQFGMNFQACVSALEISEVSWEFIQPKTWQKVMFEGSNEIKNSKGKKDTKAMALMVAQRLFPDVDLTPTARSVKPHDGIVDALLICEYLQRRK